MRKFRLCENAGFSASIISRCDGGDSGEFSTAGCGQIDPRNPRNGWEEPSLTASGWFEFLLGPNGKSGGFPEAERPRHTAANGAVKKSCNKPLAFPLGMAWKDKKLTRPTARPDDPHINCRE
jgi:hypothetical protein